MKTRNRNKSVLTLAVVAMAAFAMTTSAYAVPIDTGPVTLHDFYGAGSDLGASVISGQGQHNTSTFEIEEAFDDTDSTSWVLESGHPQNTTISDLLSIELTGAPALGVSIDRLLWNQRPGTLKIDELGVTYYSDSAFTNVITTESYTGLDGINLDDSFTAVDGVKSVRFSGVAVGSNPGASTIGLFGADTIAAIIPEPSTFVMAVLGLLTLTCLRSRRRRTGA